MRYFRCFVLLLFCSLYGHAQANSYLFVWAGDDAKQSSDFLAVLDADPKSPHYGQPVASVAVPGPGGTPHHTEATMPADGFLLANAFESGRTTLFDLRDPLHPSVVTSFGDLDGYMHPHTYIRLSTTTSSRLSSIMAATTPNPMAAASSNSMSTATSFAVAAPSIQRLKPNSFGRTASSPCRARPRRQYQHRHAR